jgi:hypothetical protein
VTAPRGSGYFLANLFTTPFLNCCHTSYLLAYEDGTDKSVSKRWHLNYRRWGITQKKAYDNYIQFHNVGYADRHAGRQMKGQMQAAASGRCKQGIPFPHNSNEKIRQKSGCRKNKTILDFEGIKYM